MAEESGGDGRGVGCDRGMKQKGGMKGRRRYNIFTIAIKTKDAGGKLLWLIGW